MHFLVMSPKCPDQENWGLSPVTTLLLPSSLPLEILAKTSPKLIEMEKELRLGQCQDALSMLRDHLHSRARVLKDKYINVCHQCPNTRSRGLVDRISAKIDMFAAKYRAAYAALLALDSDPAAKWRSELRPLHKKDIRSMCDTELVRPSTGSPSDGNAVPTRELLPGGVVPEGSRSLSWIWAGAVDDVSYTPDYHECTCSQPLCSLFTYVWILAFRIEWSKAYARSERWKEEVLLLREEMRRTLAFLDYSSKMWSARGSPSSLTRLSKDSTITEGLQAYTNRQSHIFTSIHHRFRSIWMGLEDAGVPATEPMPAASEDALMELLGGDI